MEVDMDEDVEDDLVVVEVECQKHDSQSDRQHNYISNNNWAQCTWSVRDWWWG